MNILLIFITLTGLTMLLLLAWLASLARAAEADNDPERDAGFTDAEIAALNRRGAETLRQKGSPVSSAPPRLRGESLIYQPSTINSQTP
jgi:hypothetical protein